MRMTHFWNNHQSQKIGKQNNLNVLGESDGAVAYLRKIAPMASTQIAFYIYYLLIISPGIHVYVYYMVFAKLLQENYLNNLFRTFSYGNIRC